MLSTAKERKRLRQFLEKALDNPSRRSLRSMQGQALVEFALVVPLLFFVVVNAVNLGGFIYAWITVANAARVGAQYAVLGGAAAGLPAVPTATQVQALVTGDTSSLAGTLSTCINKNATTSATTGTCSFTIPTIPPDPEAPAYVSVVIDVQYTFSAFFQAFRFAGLGITGLPGLPATIHRRAVMRSIQ